MKKYFAWLPALALLLTLTGCGGSIRTSPFSVTVTADSGASVEAMLGTYTWEYEDGAEWKGMTADSDHPLWCQEWMPALDASGGTVTLSAEVSPDSITVLCWSTDDWCDADYPDGEAVETEGLTFALREDGDYVYEVIAKWNSASQWEGTACYCFYTASGG
ncbi:MAG: hypothetical protein LUF84_03700 [Clostridiales bacterium]|nr:hypothetical protein [Clostridiales bacterium]